MEKGAEEIKKGGEGPATERPSYSRLRRVTDCALTDIKRRHKMDFVLGMKMSAMGGAVVDGDESMANYRKGGTLHRITGKMHQE